MGGKKLTINRKTQQEIIESIHLHRDIILKDMNLNLRLVNDEDHTYLSALVKWEKDEVTFAAPIEQCDWVIFPLPIELNLWFITKQTVFASRIQVTARERLDGKLIYKGKLITPLSKKQQRAHFRLSTLFQVHYKVLPEENTEDTSLEALPLYGGTAVNISVGGMCIVCEQQLKAEQLIDLTFCFLENEFNVRGKVLGLGDKNENGTFSHRITFLNLDTTKENLLSKSIFEKQRLLMRSSKQPLYKK